MMTDSHAWRAKAHGGGGGGHAKICFNTFSAGWRKSAKNIKAVLLKQVKQRLKLAKHQLIGDLIFHCSWKYKDY